MAELYDDYALYVEGVRRMHDASLLHWYARLDMGTRHRLLAEARARDTGTLFAPNSLARVLLMLTASGAYMQELMTIQQSMQTRLEQTVSDAVDYSSKIPFVNTRLK